MRAGHPAVALSVPESKEVGVKLWTALPGPGLGRGQGNRPHLVGAGDIFRWKAVEKNPGEGTHCPEQLN